MTEFEGVSRHIDGVVDKVLDDGTRTAWAEDDQWRIRCPECLGGEGQANCSRCAGRGKLEHVPYPDHRWDEVYPGLYVGGHASQEAFPVVVGREFGLVVSLHQEPEGVSVYGPDLYTTTHITYTMADADLDPRRHTELDVLASHVEDEIRHGGKVLVRCMAGINRSALVAALAMVKMGWLPDEAIERIRSVRSPYCLCNDSFVAYIRSKG